MIVFYMEKLKVNLYFFFKLIIVLYFLFLIFTNMALLFFSDKLIKYTLVKFDNLIESSSEQTRDKLSDLLSKYSGLLILNI